MATIFREGQPNFPANTTELGKRLTEIRQLINNDNKVSEVNINFTEAAFQLMQDCALITENIVKFLCSARNCESIDRNFRFPFNPDEGVLRAVTRDDDVLGDGGQRFYYGDDRRVELSNGQHYLFSNDWYGDRNSCPNKRAFYNWLSKLAQNACKKHWTSPDNDNAKSLPKKSENVKTENVYMGFKYERVASKIRICKYCGSEYSVTIPARINDLPVTSIGDEAFKNYTSLTEIEVPNSVESIGNRTFSGCINLKNIIIPKGVKSIGDETFKYCMSLTGIEIPDSVESIGKGTFSGCINLKNIIIPKGVKSIGDETFKYCMSLTGIEIPDSVESIGKGTFSGCINLKNIIIPKGVKSIGDETFSRCSHLEKIKLPDSITCIGNAAFWNCKSLETIHISEFALSREATKRSIDKISKYLSCEIIPIPKQ